MRQFVCQEEAVDRFCTQRQYTSFASFWLRAILGGAAPGWEPPVVDLRPLLPS